MIAVGSIAEETKVRGTVTTDKSIAGTVSKEQGIKGKAISISSIDNTLTKEGYAADSKAVGDALNTKASSDHTHTASDVGARPNTWTPTAEEVGARPSDWMPTASEVGARPSDWMPTASEVGARPSTWIPTASEVGARPNTWLPTIAEIGAAPAGFGFGGAMTYIDLTSSAYSGKTMDEALETVLGTMDSRSCAQIQFYDTSFYDNKFIGKLWKYTSKYATFEAISYEGYKAIKRKRAGTWNAWEWENPPMETNVEYKTTEKHFGNPVYVQKFKIGALPQGTNTIEHNLGISTNEIVRFDAYALKDGDYLYYSIPMISLNGNISATARVRAAKLDIIAFSDLSAYMGYMNVYYCKN